MLELMKQLLGINLADTSKDTILNFYITKAKQSIITYKNKAYTDESFEAEFSNQCVELAIYYYRNKDNIGYSSMAQGGRNVSKETNPIPNEIKLSLGLPYISTVGTVV
jgi:hypothetical protein